jgi:integrase
MNIKKAKNGQWRLDLRMGGIRFRNLFATKAEAERVAKEKQATQFMYKHNLRMLKPGAEAIASQAIQLLGPDADPKELITAVLEYTSRKQIGNRQTLSQAITAFKKDLERRNKRIRYIDSMAKVLAKFVRFFGENAGDRFVSDYTRLDVMRFLDEAIKQTPVNKFNYSRDLGVFFHWCETERIIAENPLKGFRRPTVDRKDPSTLSYEQCKNLLGNLTGQDRAYAAVALFSGTRPEEIMKMTWAMIILDGEKPQIRLPGSIAKTRIGRTIDLTPNAVAWLKPLAKPGTEPVFQGDQSCLIGRMKLAAGLDKWEQDCLRHTFTSMHCCHFQDPSKVAYYLHNRGNPDLLFRTYFRDQLTEDAKKFWSMLPPAI